MDFPLAVENNRQKLFRILATLFAAAGLAVGESMPMVQRQVRNWVLRHLRTAEAALRRLLVTSALSMRVEVQARSSATAPKRQTRGDGKSDARAPSFPLIESLPGTGGAPPRPAPGHGPRIFFFDGTDLPIEAPPPKPLPGDVMDAAGMCWRLNAFQHVLENLPSYAKRIALWQARLDAAATRIGRSRPVRLGRPAGYRRRGKHAVDAMLTECHWLMLYAFRKPDTG